MQNYDVIKLYNKPNHINEFLTHWTGRGKNDEKAFEILSIIINKGELKFSRNPISFPTPDYSITVQAICFTDTPIKQSINQCERYNYFGISFNKTEMMEYGANPVLYLINNREKNQKFIKFLKLEELVKNRR